MQDHLRGALRKQNTEAPAHHVVIRLVFSSPTRHVATGAERSGMRRHENDLSTIDNTFDNTSTVLLT